MNFKSRFTKAEQTKITHSHHPKRVPETGSKIISESKKIKIIGKAMQSVIILVLYTLLPTKVIANQGKT